VSGGVLTPGGTAWDENIVWGDALTPTGQNIVWGENCDTDDCSNIVWGNNSVWGESDETDNIVWGNTDDDNIVWGNSDDENIVWGNGDDDNIVWGNGDDENIVWGNDCSGADCDNIVWGNSDDENIVWGNAEGIDNIVWGNSADDNIVWGNSDLDKSPWAAGRWRSATTRNRRFDPRCEDRSAASRCTAPEPQSSRRERPCRQLNRGGGETVWKKCPSTRSCANHDHGERHHDGHDERLEVGPAGADRHGLHAARTAPRGCGLAAGDADHRRGLALHLAAADHGRGLALSPDQRERRAPHLLRVCRPA
jgi:hypothetical protein